MCHFTSCVVLSCIKGGYVVGNMWTMAKAAPICCMCDNDLLVKPGYVKVLKEEEGKYRARAFFCFIYINTPFLSPPLEKAEL